MTNTIGYVSTQKTQTTEEMNTDLNLDSSVELVFKTDYLPLDRLAGRDQVDRIKVNTLNPEMERNADAVGRSAREKRIDASETKRWESLDKSIAPPPAPPPKPAPGAPGSPEAAEKARKDAEERDKKDKDKKKSETIPPKAAGATPSTQPANQPATQTGGQAGVNTQVPAPVSTGGGNQTKSTTGNPPGNATPPAQAHSFPLEEISPPILRPHPGVARVGEL
jgi:hypothetical protein